MNKEYFAGIVDGEGAVSLRYERANRRFSVFFSIGNTNKEVIETIKNYLERKKIKTYLSQTHRQNNKVFYTLRTQKPKDIKKTLKLIYPSLIIKKKNVKLILKFINVLNENQKRHRFSKEQKKALFELYRKYRSLVGKTKGSSLNLSLKYIKQDYFKKKHNKNINVTLISGNMITYKCKVTTGGKGYVIYIPVRFHKHITAGDFVEVTIRKLK